MPKYPEIGDKHFYDKINTIYDEFKVKKSNKSMDEICNPKQYKLQLPQKFLAEFINPKTPYKGILVYHRIGAGKTCTAIRIAEKWKYEKKIMVILPASLKTNFRGELRSLCADNNYLNDEERNELKLLKPKDKRYKDIIKKSDEEIDKYYKIYSYNKFVDYVIKRKINLKNTLLIIDEIQNMVSIDGSFYNELYKAIHGSPNDLRIVLLSATPMFDKPSEIALTMNLLKLPVQMPIGNAFDKAFVKSKERKDGGFTYDAKNLDKLKQYMKGFVSFFRGAPPITFPKLTIKYVECVMSDFQYGAYINLLKKEESETGTSISKSKSLDVSDLPNNFYIGTRMISNIVFPNKKINDDGFDSLTDKKILDNLEMYSCKFFEIMNKIQNKSGKVFVYSSFKEFGGIKSFVKILNAFGYKDYTKDGVGSRRYAIWSGDETIAVKEEIKTMYNKKDNINGHKIKILLGSPSIKEGVSLTAVRQVHILEPYWNQSRLDQVIGRASRFCSHKDVVENNRNVKIYIYIAIAPSGKVWKQTVDQYIQSLLTEKDKLIKQFEKAIKEVAIDCTLNKNANVYEGEENIVCDK